MQGIFATALVDLHGDMLRQLPTQLIPVKISHITETAVSFMVYGLPVFRRNLPFILAILLEYLLMSSQMSRFTIGIWRPQTKFIVEPKVSMKMKLALRVSLFLHSE